MLLLNSKNMQREIFCSSKQGALAIFKSDYINSNIYNPTRLTKGKSTDIQLTLNYRHISFIFINAEIFV
jgi:hypothetical protein